MHILKGFGMPYCFNVTMNTMQAWRNTLMFVIYVICLKKHKIQWELASIPLFHIHKKLVIMALMPTLYSQIFEVLHYLYL